MSPSSAERYLVTGAFGCIGAWVVRELLQDGAQVISYDLAATSHRIPLIVEDAANDLITVQGDITDLCSLEETLDTHSITRIIHLAALQVPFCRADPPAGAAVNVVGTANIFEAVARRLDRIPHVVFASSIAAYDAYVPGQPPTMTATPGTIYGVYKRATEQMAQLYASERDVPSIGLRPHTVYGPGRDQGLTSSPTVAMLAAAAGRGYTIPYSGTAQFQYAQDAARSFIQAARGPVSASGTANLAGPVASMADVVAAIEEIRPDVRGRINVSGDPLPFPSEVPHDDLPDVLGADIPDRSLHDGVAATIHHFEQALERGLVVADTLPS
jgi:nucleoside-diphosphate-sugar epimerase